MTDTVENEKTIEIVEQSAKDELNRDINDLSKFIEHLYQVVENGDFTVESSIRIIPKLVDECQKLDVAKKDTKDVILQAVNRFLDEHKSEKAIFAFIDPFVDFAILVSDNKSVKEVKTSCFKLLSCFKK
jgi:hypothetical protein